jgi:hypothetical protein
MTDPYKDPKKAFIERQNRKGLSLDKVNAKTDFKQPLQVDFMDI